MARGSTISMDAALGNACRAVADEADLREKPERALIKMEIDNAAEAKHQLQLWP